MKKNLNHWNVTETSFTTLGYSSKRSHDPDLLYLILIEQDGIEIIKIGRTFYGVNKRFAKEDIIILDHYGLWEGTHKKVFDVEQAVLKAFAEHKYTGKFFSGSSEGFKLTLPVDQVMQFIQEEFPELILINEGETQNQSQSPSKNLAKKIKRQKRKTKKAKDLSSTIKTPNSRANFNLALQWEELLLDISVFIDLIMALDKNNFSVEAFNLLISFYSFSFGIIFLSVLVHAAEQKGISKKDIAERSSFKKIKSRLIGHAKVMQSVYSQQVLLKNALQKRISKKKLLELYDFLIYLSKNQEYSDDHRSRTQKISGKARSLPLWHPNKLLPDVNPQTINRDKAFELTTNALTQVNNQLTEEYIAEYFEINANVVIDHCSALLYPTTFEDDFERQLVLAQELGCC